MHTSVCAHIDTPVKKKKKKKVSRRCRLTRFGDRTQASLQQAILQNQQPTRCCQVREGNQTSSRKAGQRFPEAPCTKVQQPWSGWTHSVGMALGIGKENSLCAPLCDHSRRGSPATCSALSLRISQLLPPDVPNRRSLHPSVPADSHTQAPPPTLVQPSLTVSTGIAFACFKQAVSLPSLWTTP